MPLFFREGNMESDMDKPGRIVTGTIDSKCLGGWAGDLILRWAGKSGARLIASHMKRLRWSS